MFANALRTQARLSLRTAVRAAAPASRTLSVLSGTRRVTVAVPSSLARLSVSSRTFSQSASRFNENAEAVEESETIFVGNLPWSATREEITELFSEFGQVVNVRIQTHADGRPRGFAHVTFDTVKNSVSAIVSATQEPFHMAGRDLVVNYAKPKAQTRPNADPCERLYFSGCSEGEPTLREVMKNMEDNIVNIHFLRDGNTGETLPTGFVEFNTVEAATEAINLFDGTEMDSGVKLFLSYARPKKARTEGAGSRYGDRRSQNRESYKTRSYRPRERDY